MAGLVKFFYLTVFVYIAQCSRFYDYSDILLVARCQSKCANEQIYSEKHNCVIRCEEEKWTKPGSCMNNNSDSDVLCMKSCDVDSQCSGIEKCCPGLCGTTCQTPKALDDTVLPSIPWNITYQERLGNNTNMTTVVIRWQNSDGYPNTFYVVQERHHIGYNYGEEKFGDWSSGFCVPKNRLTKKFVFLPGRWYQVRVASVNMNGTRGFSTPSEPFTLSKMPNPPSKVHNLTLETVNFIGGKYWVEIHWAPPNSTLPINKYKVIWTTLQNSTTTNPSTAKLITHHEFVSRDTYHLSIPGLDPKKICLIRVQPLVLFGNKRIKGDMANILFRPQDFHDASTLVIPGLALTNNILKKKSLGIKKKINHLKVDKIFSRRNELVAKLSWSNVNSNGKDHFTVTWTSNNCGEKSRRVYTSSTDTRWYILHGLSYNCKYKVTVKTQHQRISYSSSLNFSTPQCRSRESC